MADEVDLSKIDRSIRKEPAYVSTPRYALLAFGLEAEHRSWLVIDGEEIGYIDRNGNGDLTDPEDKIELDRKATAAIRLASTKQTKSVNVFPLGQLAGTKLIFQLWAPNPEYDLEKDEKWKSSPESLAYLRMVRDKKCLNGSLMRVAEGHMQAQNPLLLAPRPDEAQICHLGGPLTFKLRWGKRQQLEQAPKESVFEVSIGSKNLPPTDFEEIGFNFSPLTTSEVPPDLHPVATFEVPSATPGGPPTRREVVLNQRCCGDNFYAQWKLPETTAERVKVTVTMPLWVGHDVKPATFEVPVNREGVTALAAP
ncbi:hypothetical protein AYO47_05160 [Planctomyces sp. SCGC AG-212-M04]|nr:hypothetical protein AYO47_05160 [Planctomyces sp. SCGC AG-212-M04]